MTDTPTPDADTHTVTTPLDDRITATTARAAGLDPETATVVDAAVRDGELALELAGEPA